MINIDSEEKYLVSNRLFSALSKLNINSCSFFWTKFGEEYDVEYDRCNDCNRFIKDCRCDEEAEENLHYKEQHKSYYHEHDEA